MAAPMEKTRYPGIYKRGKAYVVIYRADGKQLKADGSASTRSTRFPALAKTCASHTAEVVLPMPGLRFARARLRPVIQALSQRLRPNGS